MQPQTYIFERLVHANSSLVGKPDKIQIDAPQAFSSTNAPGDLHAVSDLEEVGRIARASAKLLKALK
jgi:hypothetical protein